MTRVVAALAAVALTVALVGCDEQRETPIIPGPGPSQVKVDTPELVALKARTGMEDCVPGPGGGALPDLTLKCLGGGTSVDLASLRGQVVEGVRFDEAREPGVLELSGTDAEALAAALSRHAVERGVTLSEIRLGAPPLEALLAARAAIARRYYEASYQSIAPQVAAPVAAPAPSGAPAWAPYVPDTQTAPRPPDQSVTMPTEFADPRGGKPGGET